MRSPMQIKHCCLPIWVLDELLTCCLHSASRASVQAVSATRRLGTQNIRSLNDLSTNRNKMLEVTGYRLDLYGPDMLRGKTGAQGLLRRGGECLNGSLTVRETCLYA